MLRVLTNSKDLFWSWWIGYKLLNWRFVVELPYNDYFEYYGPDFKLHISPSNMANQNTAEYLDKIKTRLYENLRMLPHAPGVQQTGELTVLIHSVVPVLCFMLFFS